MTTSSPRSDSSRSSAAFGDLAEPVQRWVWDREITKLYPIQEQAIRTILHSQNDLIIAAPTAGGKTEAAFLPLISEAYRAPNASGFDLLYVGPLRALINDQVERLEDLCRHTEIPVHAWHGDIATSRKDRAKRDPRGILLITPESLEAWFVLRGMEVGAAFGQVKAVVIDELHALLDNERGIHVRSLLTRLEIAAGRRIRRIGLSATLGEMDLAKSYLRPEAAADVELIESERRGNLKVQVRGYVVSANDDEPEATESSQRAVAGHLFETLRGETNLIFAGSRRNVELYADALRRLSETMRVPLEFFPHHSSLSRGHRLAIEERLKSNRPTTAVCTSTLELGIDIGSIESIAQIGPPFSVASLRQRLGRSGRRKGQSAVLRMYAIETDMGAEAHLADRLRLGLVQCVAMVELLKKRWIEPPLPQALHLSTFVHQVLSVIAERGGVQAAVLYDVLCRKGPFRLIGQQQFMRILRHLGRQEVALIEQARDGSILLGQRGERVVEHYSWYAVFQTPQEYRIVCEGKTLGTLPVNPGLSEGTHIIFVGRRWRVTAVHTESKVLEVVADTKGKVPKFAGTGGLVHDRVIQEMQVVLKSQDQYDYLNEPARKVLSWARDEFRLLGLNARALITQPEENAAIVATWSGSIKNATLAVVLESMGYSITQHSGLLDVKWKSEQPPVTHALRMIADSWRRPLKQVLEERPRLELEKYHRYLDDESLIEDALHSRFCESELPGLAQTILDTIE